MGNVNEIHEREAESSDDVESSSSEGNSSTQSITTLEQETLDMSGDVHLNESIMNFSLEISTIPSDQSKGHDNDVTEGSTGDGPVDQSVNDSSSDSLPLSDSILPTSFDLSEECIGSPLPSDYPDRFLTPDVSHDGMEREADLPQNANPCPVEILPPVENEVMQQITRSKVDLSEEREDKSEEHNLSTKLRNQIGAEHQPPHSKMETEFKEEAKAQRMDEDNCVFFTAENSSMIELSSSMILNDSQPLITYIHPDKSESGMTSLAEHFNAISLVEEPHIHPFEESNHPIEKESEYTSTQVAQDEISSNPEDSVVPKQPHESQSEADLNGPPISEGINTEPDVHEPRQMDIPANLPKAPLSRFDSPISGSDEAKNLAILATKDVYASSTRQTEAVLPADESLTLDDSCINELLKPQELASVSQVQQALSMRPENPSSAIRVPSPPKHTADKPNWALAPDSPPKPKSSSSAKRRKRGPRRGRQTDNDPVPASPDELRLSSNQRNAHRGSEARKQPRRDNGPAFDVDSKATGVPNGASPDEIVPIPRLTEFSSLPIQSGCNTMIGESLNSCPLADTVSQGVLPEMPAASGNVANASQSTTNLNRSLSPHARILQSNDPSEDNANPISFGHKDKTVFLPSRSSEHGAAHTLASVGSSIGLQSKNPGREAIPSYESPENGLAHNIFSAASSVTSHMSSERLSRPSWPSLEEEMRFHAANRSSPPGVHDPSKSTLPDEMFTPTLYPNSLLERHHFTRRTADDDSDALVAVTKTRHLVFEESINPVEDGARSARVNIPCRRSKSIEFETQLQPGATRISRPPFQSGIPIPTRGQFHRDFINVPREPRLSVPEERIVHDVSSQTLVSQNTSRASSLSQKHRTASQPFMIRQPIATSSHPNGPIPTISSNRNPIVLPVPRSRPSNFDSVSASRYSVQPCANVARPYPLTAVIDIHEGRCENTSSTYQPHYDIIPYTRSFTMPQGGGYPMKEQRHYPSHPGTSNHRNDLN